MNHQGTKGNYSPNLNGINTDGGDIVFGDIHLKPTGKETSSILQVISDLSQKAVKLQDGIDDTRYRKRLKEKLALYPEHALKMKYDYASLIGLYAGPYELAWENSDVDELTRIKIARHLSSRSITLLEEQSGNAIMAVNALCNELESSIPKKVTYDSSAVRFFIYRQFIECNVFPIIIDDLEE